MAGGIDWFRWHHGSVTDPKFQLVARKAGASLPDVLAVWAYLLEQASASEQRGSIGEIDAEALDCLFGFPSTETRTADILKAFKDRGLLDGQQVAAWEKRQPKRERDTDSSAERTRAYRERQKAPAQTTESHVTPCDASEHQKNARGEERREEIPPTDVGGKAPRKRRAPPSDKPMASIEDLAQAGIPADVAAEFIAHKAEYKAPLTSRAWLDHLSESAKAGWTPLQAAEKVMARSWKGFEAKYVVNEQAPAARQTYGQQAADIARTTVPAKPGRDPTLARIEADALAAAPAPQAARDLLAKLKTTGAPQ